jgi:hypothetical protein
VETRKRLAQKLRAEVNREAAEAVREARKPTVAAWAVNRVVRDFPKQARDLVKAGAALRAAQVRIIQGGQAGAMQERLTEARDLIARLTRAARQLLDDESRASDATLDRVSETLMASLADESRAELLAQGRLTKEMEPSGFGLPAGVTPAPRAKSASTREQRHPDDSTKRKRVAEARARLKEAEQELAERRQKLQAAEAAQREAASRAESAARETERAQDAVERASRSVEQAAEEVDDARR